MKNLSRDKGGGLIKLKILSQILVWRPLTERYKQHRVPNFFFVEQKKKK